MRHIPRKRFGQHFLTDPSVIDAIVRAIDPQPSDAMVEIGPGLGALTAPLVERLGHLTVIELDRDLAARLNSDACLTVIEADALRVDFAALAPDIVTGTEPPPGRPKAVSTPTGGSATGEAVERGGSISPPPGRPKAVNAPAGGSAPCAAGSVEALRLCGNLPYNISTPLLFHLLGFASSIVDQHFMLQKEVVDRMVAKPSTADYGRLSVMLQWRYAMEGVLTVPPAAFDPPPRVMSAVVRMRPRTDFAKIDEKLLSELVQVAFSQRRKLLRHTLGHWLEARRFGGSFDVQRRAEEVPVAEYLALGLALGTQ